MLPYFALNDRQEAIVDFAKKEKFIQTRDIFPVIKERFGAE